MTFIRLNPFVRVLFPFVIGVLLNNIDQLSFNFLKIVTGSLFVVTLLFYRYSKRSISIYPRLLYTGCHFVFFIAIGFLVAQIKVEQKHQNVSLIEAHNQVQILFFKCISEPIEKPNSFLVEVELLSNAHASVCGYAYFKKGINLPHSGSLISIKCKLSRIRLPTNPGQFNFRNFAEQNNRFFSIYIEKYQELGSEKSRLNFFYSIQQQGIKIFKQYLKKDELAIACALVLGDKNYVTENVREAYSSVGAMHVLAVSGLHVGLVYLFLNFCFSYFNKFYKYRWFVAITIVLIMWLYAGVTGFSPSVTRATFMFSLIALGKQLNRVSSIYNIILASAFFTLLFNPDLIYNVSFQLSYSAVLGIVYFYPHFFSLWQAPNTFVAYFWSLICLSLAAQLATLPFTLFYFNQFPTWFLLTNMLVIPAAMAELAGGALLIVAHYLNIGEYIGLIYQWLIKCVNYLIFLIQDLPPGAIIWSITWLQALLLVLSVLCFVLLLETLKTWSLHLFLFSVLLFSVVWLKINCNRYSNSGIIAYNAKATCIELFSRNQSIVWLDTNAMGLEEILNNTVYPRIEKTEGSVTKVNHLNPKNMDRINLVNQQMSFPFNIKSNGFRGKDSNKFILVTKAPKWIPIPDSLVHWNIPAHGAFLKELN